jgi:mRNA interferase MazF
MVSQFTTTVITIPLTTLRWANLPTCFLIPSGEAGLAQDSVALCYQRRVLDKTRLRNKLDQLKPETVTRLGGYSLIDFRLLMELYLIQRMPETERIVINTALSHTHL